MGAFDVVLGERTVVVDRQSRYTELEGWKVGVQKTRKVITLGTISFGDDGDGQGIGKPHGFL